MITNEIIQLLILLVKQWSKNLLRIRWYLFEFRCIFLRVYLPEITDVELCAEELFNPRLQSGRIFTKFSVAKYQELITVK